MFGHERFWSLTVSNLKVWSLKVVEPGSSQPDLCKFESLESESVGSESLEPVSMEI